MVGAVAVIGLAILYKVADPSKGVLFPKCPIKMLTGYSCPGCGSQRAVHALLNLDFVEAFRQNALMTVSLPFIALLVYSEATRQKHRKLYMALSGKVAIAAYIVVIFTWWIGRNIMGI